MQLPIYLDNHATTPCDPQVVEAMQPFFTTFFGNPSSRNHLFGAQAEEAVEAGRAQVAALIGAAPKEVIFTSGATESNNLAIRGVVEATGKTHRHVITAAIEHHAVLEPCKHLERLGHRVTVLPVDRYGLVDLHKLREAFRPETVLVSMMMANNEIGTIAPMAEIAAITHEQGALLHSDLAQAAGKISIAVKQLGIDLASFAAHKMYGPKGVGALYVRGAAPPIHLATQMAGGGQERGLRSGTYNVPSIAGFGKAAQLCRELMESESARIEGLRSLLFNSIKQALPDVALNGHPTRRLPGNVNVSLPGVASETILAAFRKEIAISSGAACTSTTNEPSHVLRAIGVRKDLIDSSLRFGIGRFNTEEEINYVAQRLIDEVRRMQGMAATGKGLPHH
jgi:cysteine desulfurase